MSIKTFPTLLFPRLDLSLENDLEGFILQPIQTKSGTSKRARALTEGRNLHFTIPLTLSNRRESEGIGESGIVSWREAEWPCPSAFPSTSQTHTPHSLALPPAWMTPISCAGPHIPSHFCSLVSFHLVLILLDHRVVSLTISLFYIHSRDQIITYNVSCSWLYGSFIFTYSLRDSREAPLPNSRREEEWSAWSGHGLSIMRFPCGFPARVIFPCWFVHFSVSWIGKW